MTPEGKVKERVRQLLKKFEPYVWYFMPVSMGAGQHGIPDFIICANSWFITVECKAGTPVTELQAMQMDRIYKAGGQTFVVDEGTNLSTLEAHLNMMVSSARTAN